MSAWEAAVQSVGTVVLLVALWALLARLHWLSRAGACAPLGCPHNVSEHDACPMCQPEHQGAA